MHAIGHLILLYFRLWHNNPFPMVMFHGCAIILCIPWYREWKGLRDYNPR